MRVVVDTSAVVAILAGKPKRDPFVDLLLRSEPAISVGSVIETVRTVQLRYGAERIEDVHQFFATAGMQIIACDAAQARLNPRQGCYGRDLAQSCALQASGLDPFAQAREVFQDDHAATALRLSQVPC